MHRVLPHLTDRILKGDLNESNMSPQHKHGGKVRHTNDVSIEEEDERELGERKGPSLEALRGKQSEREGERWKVGEKGESLKVNTMGAVISDGGHLIPKSRQEAASSDYCLKPVCCSTPPYTL